jgi:hypothetical protein
VSLWLPEERKRGSPLTEKSERGSETASASKRGDLEDGAAVYEALLKEEIAGQETRKSSFEQRGLAVVTTAGALVTLLFGLAALATKTAHAKPFSTEEKIWLAAALVLFVLSAISVVLTNWPLKYEVANPTNVKERLEESPIDDADTAHKKIAVARVKMLIAAKGKNGWKGRFLFGAMTLEVAAVLCVGVAIFEVINP